MRIFPGTALSWKLLGVTPEELSSKTGLQYLSINPTPLYSQTLEIWYSLYSNTEPTEDSQVLRGKTLAEFLHTN